MFKAKRLEKEIVEYRIQLIKVTERLQSAHTCVNLINCWLHLAAKRRPLTDEEQAIEACTNDILNCQGKPNDG